jgi:hypothetical protein
VHNLDRSGASRERKSSFLFSMCAAGVVIVGKDDNAPILQISTNVIRQTVPDAMGGRSSKTCCREASFAPSNTSSKIPAAMTGGWAVSVSTTVRDGGRISRAATAAPI